MLQLPSVMGSYRILGIDPGSDTLGIALVEIDLATKQLILLEAFTANGTQMARTTPNVVAVHGDRTARLWAHENNLYGYMRYAQPHAVISESPFMGKFPQAFATLTECMSCIRRAVYRYNPFMPLLTVDPPTVKLLVGVKGKGTTKDDVKRGLLKIPYLLNPYNIDIAELDEHSVDAIVVALTRAVFFLHNL